MNAAERLSRARSQLVRQQPFFGCLALNLILREDDAQKTMETDGRELVYSPAFVEKLTDAELRGVLAHETMHCALQHMTRRGGRDPELWNRAADFSINGDLKRAGFTLPAGAPFEPRFDGKSAEEIFAALDRERQQQGKPRQKPQGSPQAGGNDPGGCGGVKDAAAPHEPAKAQETAARWNVATAQALAVAKAQNAGRLPAYLERLAEEKAAPVIDWREQLRRFVDSTARADYSWTRPNRRFIGAGFYLPGTQPDGLNRLVAIVDTSGSVTDSDLAAFRAEIAAAVEDGAADALTVIFTDTKVQAVQEFTRGDEIKLHPKGGGGTDFAEVMDRLDEIAPDASAVLFLTDLETNSFGREPAAPVLWVATSDAPAAPYGETVRLI